MTDHLDNRLDLSTLAAIEAHLSSEEKMKLIKLLAKAVPTFLRLALSASVKDLSDLAALEKKVEDFYTALEALKLKADGRKADALTKPNSFGTIPFLALSDFCEEGIPDVNPRNASGWAKWLSQSQPDWGHDEPARDKDTFAAEITIMALHLVQLPRVPDPRNLEASRSHINFPPDTMYLHLMEGTVDPYTDPSRLPLWITDRSFTDDMDVLRYMASSNICTCAVVVVRPHPGRCTFTYHLTPDGPLGTIQLPEVLERVIEFPIPDSLKEQF